MAKGYEVSFEGNENVLKCSKIDCDDGWTTLNILNPLNYTL